MIGCDGSGRMTAGASSATTARPTDTGTADPGYTATKYPIVLIHGLFGFRSLLGTLDYFPAIPEALEEGGATVFVVTASQAADTAVRAQELIPQLERIRAESGAERLNLFGHSQGSIDARYIAATRPDLVASVTSIGGPHKGSPVANLFLKLPAGVAAAQWFADTIKLLSGSSDPNDARAVLEFLQPQKAAAFNAKFPAAVPTSACGEGEPVVDGIRYYSWGGIGWLTNALDPLDVAWPVLGATISEPNDGVVGRCSSHLGELIRDDYLGNHVDESNMLFGLVSPLGADPKTLYRVQANRLKKAGL
jgi:triacylglycerol lipase